MPAYVAVGSEELVQIGLAIGAFLSFTESWATAVARKARRHRTTCRTDDGGRT
jgi:hypothetical protein